VRRIAHIVNPVLVGESSDLFLAQPITFETMRIARDFSAGKIHVELLSAQYPEDHPLVPADFCRTPDLETSILDHGRFHRPRKLPLLRDILDRLHGATDAEYMIYTNVDIGLQPHFYLAVDQFIEEGFDAFVINRRTVSDRYLDIRHLPMIYSQTGQPHRGWDCFVFPRDAYLHYRLGTVCIGIPRADLALIANMVACATRFWEFKNRHLTFHLGNERAWRSTAFSDYADHNTREALRILSELEAERGSFDRSSPPGSFLFKYRRFGGLYELWVRHGRLPVSTKRWLEACARRMPLLRRS
jgi:hypothetical protein